MARVLLVEDNDTNRKAMCRVLESDGNFVESVWSGELALNMFENTSTGFDVILMDVGLPGMDGIETTQHLRELGFHGPIIAFTAHNECGIRERACNAGCNDFRVKPIKNKDLKEIVRHITFNEV